MKKWMAFIWLLQVAVANCSNPAEPLAEATFSQQLVTILAPEKDALGHFSNLPNDLRLNIIWYLDPQSAARLSACNRQLRLDYQKAMGLIDAQIDKTGFSQKLFHPRLLLKLARMVAKDVPLRTLFAEECFHLPEYTDQRILAFLRIMNTREDLAHMLLCITLSLCPAEDCRLVVLVSDLLRNAKYRTPLFKLIDDHSRVASDLGLDFLVHTEEAKTWMMSAKLLGLAGINYGVDEVAVFIDQVGECLGEREINPLVYRNFLWLCYLDSFDDCETFSAIMLSGCGMGPHFSRELSKMKAMANYLDVMSRGCEKGVISALCAYGVFLEVTSDRQTCLRAVQDLLVRAKGARIDSLFRISIAMHSYPLVVAAFEGDMEYQACLRSMIAILQERLKKHGGENNVRDPDSLQSFIRLHIAELILFLGDRNLFPQAEDYLIGWDEKSRIESGQQDGKGGLLRGAHYVWYESDGKLASFSRPFDGIDILLATIALYQRDDEKLKLLLKKKLPPLPVFILAMKRMQKQGDLPDFVVRLSGNLLARAFPKLRRNRMYLKEAVSISNGLHLYFRAMYDEEFLEYYLRRHPIVRAWFKKLVAQ